MRAINRRSGYQSVYDESTKRAMEASEFIDARLLYCDGKGGKSDPRWQGTSISAAERGHRVRGGNGSHGPPPVSPGV